MRFMSIEFGRCAAFGVATLAGLLLQGCNPVPVVSTTRLYAVDQQGASRDCKVKAVVAQPGKAVTSDMSVANDGGWCALSISTSDGAPYGAGLLTDRPAHGTVYIHTVGNATRIDYTPARGYVGPDKFSTLLVPGDATIAFNVTVAPR